MSLLPSSLAWRLGRARTGPRCRRSPKTDRPSTTADLAAIERQPLQISRRNLKLIAAKPGRAGREATGQRAGSARPSRAVAQPAIVRAAAVSSEAPALGWTGVTVAAVFVQRGLMLARLMIGYWGAHRLARGRADIPRPLGCRVRVAASDAVRMPVTLGLLRPMILLPADWSRWSDALLSSVVTHEQAHVDRAIIWCCWLRS